MGGRGRSRRRPSGRHHVTLDEASAWRLLPWAGGSACGLHAGRRCGLSKSTVASRLCLYWILWVFLLWAKSGAQTHNWSVEPSLP